MAFTVRKLSVLAYANGFTLWLYKTTNDGLDAIASEGFFGDAGDILADGDIMMVSAADGARLLRIGRPDAGQPRTTAVG